MRRFNSENGKHSPTVGEAGLSRKGPEPAWQLSRWPPFSTGLCAPGHQWSCECFGQMLAAGIYILLGFTSHWIPHTLCRCSAWVAFLVSLHTLQITRSPVSFNGPKDSGLSCPRFSSHTTSCSHHLPVDSLLHVTVLGNSPPQQMHQAPGAHHPVSSCRVFLTQHSCQVCT